MMNEELEAQTKDSSFLIPHSSLNRNKFITL